MHSRSLHRNGGVLCVVLSAVGLLSACSSGDSSDRPAAAAARPCPTPADSILGLATMKFLNKVSPKPHRLLVPVATDSALPESAYWALQSTGATVNVFPRDTSTQSKLRKQLSANGSYTLFLVNYHGQKKLADGRTSLEFSGHYLSGASDGTAVPRTTVVFSCNATGDRFAVEAPVSGT